MFNRLAKILCVSKKQIKILKQPFFITNKNSTNINHGLLLKKHFCSSDVVKPTNTSESPENKTEITNKKNNLTAALEADPTLEKRYKILQLELDVMRHAGKLVPDNLKPDDWLQLLGHKSRSARRKYLEFLFVNQMKRKNAALKKEQARIEREKLREEEVNNSQTPEDHYRLNKIAMFMRIYDTAINQFYHSRLIHAMMFNPKLVLDCGYWEKMTPRECANTAKQLTILFCENRLHPDPFDIHFCNVNKSSLIMQRLHKRIPTIYDPVFPLNITEKSYTDVFDRHKIVYLTPDCNNILQEYDPDAVYVIGAIVDRSNSDPLSLAKAKKEGLKMAKLPLDKYLLWGSGSSKRLPLNIIVNILTDLRITGDWQKALKHIPTRKLEKPIDDLQSDSVRREKKSAFYDSSNRFVKENEDEMQNSFTFKNRVSKS